MRKRIYYKVCSCTPTDGIVHLETRLLQQLLRRDLHSIECAAHPRRKAQKGLRLGDLCANTGHPVWAMRLWSWTLNLVGSKDYDEWIDEWLDTKYVRLANVVSEEEAKELGRRIDQLWERLGHPEMKDAEREAELIYDWLWYEKYDHWRYRPSKEELQEEAEQAAWEATCALFNDGQSDWQPWVTRYIWDIDEN